MGGETARLPCAAQAILELAAIRFVAGALLKKMMVCEFLVSHPSLLIAAVQSVETEELVRVSTLRTWTQRIEAAVSLAEIGPAKNELVGRVSFWKRLARMDSQRSFGKAVRKLFDDQTDLPSQPKIKLSRVPELADGAFKAIRKAAKKCLSGKADGNRSLQLPAILECLNRSRKIQFDFDAELSRQKLNSMRLLAYGASHEINNPLANVATRAQSLLQGETDPKRQHRLTVIYEQAMRAHEMISDMMLFAHPPAIDLRQVNLFDVAHTVVGELSDVLKRTRIDCEIICQESHLIMGDETKLGAAIRSLLANAIEAIGSDGRIEIEIERDGTNTLSLSVSDDGPGIDDEISENIFDPFFSGREAGRGLGFGLSKTWRIVQMHDANIERSVSKMGGARFTIHFPEVSNTQQIGSNPASIAA